MNDSPTDSNSRSPASAEANAASAEAGEAFCTRSIHGGLGPDPGTGAILTPIHQSTTFVQAAVGVDKGFTYSRSGNPTVAALERNLGALEHAPAAASFATGMAAITALALSTLRAGDRVLLSDVVYGGTLRLLRDVLAPFGVSHQVVDSSDSLALREALKQPTRLVVVESPANPTLKLTDLRAAAAAAHDSGALLAVDNTVLTAALQRPFELGADVVVYSTTKFIEGHNTTVGGALLSRDQALLDRFRFVQNAVGFAQAPFEAWLTLRGIKTLELRVRQHSYNALRVARFLESHPAVARIWYPGLPSFPQYELAQAQQDAGGGLLAFELVGGAPAGRLLMERVKLCSLAENLGAVETLITHPATMTHSDIPPAQRQAVGISDGLVRLSVGLEDPDDIVADLTRALAEIADPARGAE
ncbi:MAG: PLP-dependent aspartate aminotransferase family protein [Proteobacteria bacterium]|nr:PLP-dependent aspartate aminotransferase family protein [Pseudomonadota bacterium]